MQLRYREDLTIESKDRDAFRNLLNTLCWRFSDDHAFGRLLHDEDVPAKCVAAVLRDLKRWASAPLDEYDRRAASPDVLKRFKAYTQRQIKLEAVAALADRLVAAAVGAGLTYSTSQTMFVRALDRYNEAHPEAFHVEGW